MWVSPGVLAYGEVSVPKLYALSPSYSRPLLVWLVRDAPPLGSTRPTKSLESRCSMHKEGQSHWSYLPCSLHQELNSVEEGNKKKFIRDELGDFPAEAGKKPKEKESLLQIQIN